MPIEAVQSLLAASEKHPLLTAEEEKELSRTYQDGVAARDKLRRARSPKTVASLQEKIRRGGEARDRLVLANIRLVVSVAQRYRRAAVRANSGRWTELEDDVQQGILGLYRTVEKFDPERGIRFSTYAVPWIRQFIQRGIDDGGPTIRIPVHMADRRRMVRRAQERLRKERGNEEISAEEIAAATGLKETEVDGVDRLPWTVSLDKLIPTADGEDLDRHRFVADETDVEEEALGRIMRDRLTEAVREALTPEQFEVLRLRYGEGMLLREIGEAFHFTRERARQVQNAALERLRDRLEANGSG